MESNGDVILNNSYWTGGIESGIVNYGTWIIPALYPVMSNAGGLGTAANYFHTAYIHHIYSTGIVTWPSDKRAKENIREIEGALEIIDKLNPVKFDIKESFYASLSKEAKKEYNKNVKDKLGFIAQEIKEVLPTLVQEEPATGYMGIKTYEIVPILVKAIKEQQKIIVEMQEQINNLENDCCINNGSLKSGTTDSDSALDNDKAKLYQNTPNPFKNQTEVRSYIPKEAVNLMLHIFNMNGIQLEQIKITGTGNQLVKVNGNRFKPGMYLYSLIIDGREIDTKRMILTK